MGINHLREINKYPISLYCNFSDRDGLQYNLKIELKKCKVFKYFIFNLIRF